MSKLHGGVYITNPNGLRGDIVEGHDDSSSKFMVQLRGSKGAAIPVEDDELVEYASKERSTKATNAEEDIRYHLYQAAQQSDDFYLQERILTLELGDEFTYLFVSNSMGEEALPAETEGQALVRLVEAYYVGQGFVIASGRHLTSFHKALRPFWRESDDGEFSKLPAESTSEIFQHLQHIFEEAESGLLFFRAFCYAQHRLDYHNRQAESDDTLLDAYCVCFFVIQLLQGKIVEFSNMEFSPVIEEELVQYKSADIHMTADDLLWCFCILLLRIGTDVRRYHGLPDFNSILGKPFDLAMHEELFVAQLATELRPESPVSFLSAYRMVMDMKPVVPTPFRDEWLQYGYEYSVRGLKAADHWGDPFFQYVFHMFVAYWLPTASHTPNKYSLAEIQSRMHVANRFQKDCQNLVPKYMLWIGRQHEIALENTLKLFSMLDKDKELTFPLVDAFSYTTPQRKSEPLPATTACAHCSKHAENLLNCSRCGKVQYCDKTCQIEHWKASHCKECISKTDMSNSCGSCSKTLQKKLECAKCGTVSYCNRKCQLEHWKKGHKQECKKLCKVTN